MWAGQLPHMIVMGKSISSPCCSAPSQDCPFFVISLWSSPEKGPVCTVFYFFLFLWHELHALASWCVISVVGRVSRVERGFVLGKWWRLTLLFGLTCKSRPRLATCVPSRCLPLCSSVWMKPSGWCQEALEKVGYLLLRPCYLFISPPPQISETQEPNRSWCTSTEARTWRAAGTWLMEVCSPATATSSLSPWTIVLASWVSDTSASYLLSLLFLFFLSLSCDLTVYWPRFQSMPPALRFRNHWMEIP